MDWRTTVGGAFQIYRPPAYADGRVFAGADGYGLVAVEAATGTQIWSRQTGDAALGTPVVAGDTVFLGGTGQLTALDVATGVVRWQSSQDFGSPAVAGEVGYTAGSDGVVTAYDLADGTPRWRTAFSGDVRPGAVASGIVYVAADTEQRLYALDADSGGELWSIGVDGPNWCCTSVAHGMVFVGTLTGTVYAIGGNGASLQPHPHVGPTPTLTPAPPTLTPAGSSASPAAPPLASFEWQATSPEHGFVAGGLSRAPDGNLWVSDVGNNRFAIFSPYGTYLESWGHPGNGKGELNLRRPNGDPFGSIAFEPDGSFFVLDVGNQRVEAFDARRRYVTQWGGFGNEPGKYNDPVGIAVGPDGNVSVLDDRRNVVETYRRDGTFVRSFKPFAGTTGDSGSLAIDGDGNVYLSADAVGKVWRFDPSGSRTGIFGSAGDSPGAFSDEPGQVAVDADGRLFVTQVPSAPGSRGVLVFATDGTFLGSWGERGKAPGQLGFPWGIALDGAGNAYVSEYGGDPGIPSLSRLQGFQLAPP